MKNTFALFLILVSVLFLPLSGFRPATSYVSLYDSIIPAFQPTNHKASNKRSFNEVLGFETGFHNDHYLADSLNRSAYFFIQAAVSSFQNDTARRVPLNISIVIDRSGSMQGVKMGFAKKAAKNIIDQLRYNDMVSIVIYDNSIDSVQPPVLVTDQEQIKKRINSIAPRGSTNLWGGTEMGYDFVKRNYQQGYINRVLLISDGIANTGLTDSNLIRLHVKQYRELDYITISTFGVGLDYNERLLTDMAETGSGNYYFIDAAEKMTDLFEKELAGLLSVAAREAEFRIIIPRGVRMEKAYPLPYQMNGDEVLIKLRDLFSLETKAMLLKFHIDDTVKSVLEFKTYLDYTDVITGKRSGFEHKHLLQPVKNRSIYTSWFNRMVIQQVLLFHANENMEKAMEFVDRGEIEQARNLLSTNAGEMKRFAAYIKDSPELQRMDSISKNYMIDLPGARQSTDSLKKLQKASKAANYELRHKKQ